MSAPRSGEKGRALAARFRLRRGGFELEVELAVDEPGILAVFGPSGSGKTTLLRCLAGLQRADGELTVGGERWQDGETFLPPHRRGVGYVFQEAELFPHLSVRRNLEYGWKRTPAGERRVGFEQAIDWLGARALLDRRPASLSGGERQRVAVARALLASPRLLLMDEPLAALDAQARAEILPSLSRLATDLAIPVVYVTHSESEVLRLADRVLLLAAGRVRAEGPIEEIATRLDLLPWTKGGEIGAVVSGRIGGHDAEYDLTYLDFAGGTLTLPRQPLPVGSPLRLRCLARDVSLALERPVRSSILNVVPARVLEIAEPPGGQPLVKISAGGAILLAQITRKSLALLALAPGTELFAEVKGVALGA